MAKDPKLPGPSREAEEVSAAVVHSVPSPCSGNPAGAGFQKDGILFGACLVLDNHVFEIMMVIFIFMGPMWG